MYFRIAGGKPEPVRSKDGKDKRQQHVHPVKTCEYRYLVCPVIFSVHCMEIMLKCYIDISEIKIKPIPSILSSEACNDILNVQFVPE